MIWRIGEILIQKKLISWEQLQDSLQEQKSTQEPIGEILVRKKVIPKSLLYRALAEQFGIRFIDPTRTHINPKALELVPASVARKYQILPIEIDNQALVIGVADPMQAWPEEEVKRLAGVLQFQKVLCSPESLDQAIKEQYPN